MAVRDDSVPNYSNTWGLIFDTYGNRLDLSQYNSGFVKATADDYEQDLNIGEIDKYDYSGDGGFDPKVIWENWNNKIGLGDEELFYAYLNDSNGPQSLTEVTDYPDTASYGRFDFIWPVGTWSDVQFDSTISAPSTVEKGTSFSIDYTVTNNGSESGTHDIVLSINGSPTKRVSDVSLSSGQSTSGSFTYTHSTEEDINLKVDVGTRNSTELVATTGAATTTTSVLEANITATITGTNSPVNTSDTVNINVTAESTGYPTSANITLEADGTQRDSQTTSELSNGQTESITLSWDTQNAEYGDYTVTVTSDVGNNSDSTSVTLESTDFSISVSSYTNTVYIPTDQFTCDVTVANDGNISGTENISLSVDGNQKDSASVSVGSSSSSTQQLSYEPSTPSTYTVSVDSDNSGSTSFTYDAVEIQPPNNVTASSATREIAVSWDNAGGAQSYTIYRSQTTGSSVSDYTEVTTTTSTSYTDTGLLDGEQYYYVITTVRDGYESSISAEQNATTSLSPPSNVDLTAVQTDQQQSVTGVDSGFITARTSTGTQSIDTGFQPDIILFTATNTVPSSSTGSESQTVSDYGWCHGVADFINNTQHALFSGTGSSSTNGQASEITNSECLNILELPSDGNGISTRITATASQDTSGFTLDYSTTGKDEKIQYWAYQFNDTGSVDTGITTARTSTGTQSISTTVEPDFVKLIGHPRLTSTSETIQDSSDWGISHGWLTDSAQYAMAFASYSNNVDDHVWGGRNDSCLLIHHADSKGGITGTTEATGSLTTDGFDLEYSSVDGTGEAVIYVAISADEGIELTTTTAPETTGTTTVSGDFRDAHFIANATIDNLTSSESSGGNQDTITYGWSHGGGATPESQSVLAIGASSNSINDHRYYGNSSDAVRLLFTDQNASNDGSDDATWDAANSTELTVTWDNTIGTGQSNVESSHATNPIIIWGFKTAKPAQDGTEIVWSKADNNLSGTHKILRSAVTTDTFETRATGLSSETTQYTDVPADPNTGYEYKVTRLVDTSATTTASIRVVSAPTDLTLDTSTTGTLTIDWTEDNNATGYYVYRAEESGTTESDYTQVADVTAPPYTDTSLEDGEKYFYRIKSYS